jgi:hypothetical protein
VLISLAIAFARGWKLTLICLSTFPLMIVAQYFQFQFIAGAGGDSNKVRALSQPPELPRPWRGTLSPISLLCSPHLYPVGPLPHPSLLSGSRQLFTV